MNIQQMMKQAQTLQKQMQKQKEQFEAQVFDFTSAGGAIKISITGGYEIKDLQIDKDIIEPEQKDMLEDMVKMAVNEAISNVKQAEEAMAPKMPGGLF